MCLRRVARADSAVCDRMCLVMCQERSGSARSVAAPACSDINNSNNSSNINSEDSPSGFRPPRSTSASGADTRQEHRNGRPLLSRDLSAAAGHLSSCTSRARVFLLCDDSASTHETNNMSKTNNNNHGDTAHEPSVNQRELARRGDEEVRQTLADVGLQVKRKIRTSHISRTSGGGDYGDECSEQQVRVAPGCGGTKSEVSERNNSEKKAPKENIQLPDSISSDISTAKALADRMPSFRTIATGSGRRRNNMNRSRTFLGQRGRINSKSSSSSRRQRSRTRQTCPNSNKSFLDFTLPTKLPLLIFACILVSLVKTTSADTLGKFDEHLVALPPFAPVRRSPASNLLYDGGGSGGVRAASVTDSKWQPPLSTATYSDREQSSAAPNESGVDTPTTSGHNSGPQTNRAHEHEAASSMSSPKFTRTNELEAFLDDMNHKELQTVASGRPIEDLFQPKPFDVSALASNSNRRPQTQDATGGGRSMAASGSDKPPSVQSRRHLDMSQQSSLMDSQSAQQIYSDCALILQRTYVKNIEDSKHQLVPFGKTEQACISYKHIDKAIEQAKHKLKFKEFVKLRQQTAGSSSSAAAPPPPPLDVLHTSLEPPEDLVAAIGEINMAATQIIADQFDLSNDELLNGLPLIDMSKTKFAAICPLLVRQDLKCEVTRFRTFTAHCNNLKHPTWGAAKTPYARYLPPVHPDGIWVPRKSIVSEITIDLGVGHRETHTDFSPSVRLPSVHQDDAHHGRQHFPATSPIESAPFGGFLEHHHRMGSSPQPLAPPASNLNSLDEPNISELESQADAELMRETRLSESQPASLDTAGSVSFVSHAHPGHSIQLGPPLERINFAGHLDHIRGSGGGVATPAALMPHHQSQMAAAAFNEAAAAHAHIQHMDPQLGERPSTAVAGAGQPLGSLALQSLPAPSLHHQGSHKTRSVPQELPSARLVSSLVHRDADVPHHEFSMLFQSWGQLLDHDMTRAAAPPQTIKCCPAASGQPASKHKLCLPIKVPANDPFYSKFNVQCLEFRRTLASVRPNCVLGPRVHQNANTAPIDANFVYGSARATADLLRLFKGGRLRDRDWFRAEGLKPLLPAQEIDPDLNCLGRPRDMFCFLGGDVRVNEQTHLTVLHTLYMREHNRIADRLSELNPHWDDERTFQETRHLVAAGVQHVLVNEYIPLLIGRKMTELYNLTVSMPDEFAHHEHPHHHHHHHKHAPRGLYWHGYDPTVTTSVANSFAAAAFRQGHTFVQSTIDRFNKFHEFVASEKLRHLFMQPFLLYQPGVMDELISGMINRQSQSYDPFMTVELAGHLFQPPEAEFGLDLAAINVQRGRDQGLPGYNLFREWCGLPRAESFEQLEPYLTNRTAFLYSKLYKHVDDIDLWSAGVSERKLPGAAIGPTFSCIIARQFSNTRRGDRFWYENPNLPSSFTPDQLNEIKKISLAKLLCNNADDLPTIQRWAFRVAHPVLNPRVECSQLPDIDLQYWQEE